MVKSYFAPDVLINLRYVSFKTALNCILKINNVRMDRWKRRRRAKRERERAHAKEVREAHDNTTVSSSAIGDPGMEWNGTETKANIFFLCCNNVSQYCGSQSERHFYLEVYTSFPHLPYTHSHTLVGLFAEPIQRLILVELLYRRIIFSRLTITPKSIAIFLA